MYAIVNCKLITPSRTINNGVIVMNGDKIVSLGERRAVRIPRCATKLDVHGCFVAPGFIDVHVHGARGEDFSTADETGIEKILKGHSKFGTTSLLPTLVPMPERNIEKAIRVIRNVMKEAPSDAEILGVNMEGPYLSPLKKGALSGRYLQKSSSTTIRLVNDIRDMLRIMVVAPELPGTSKLIRHLHKLGVVVSVGHSAASYGEVEKAAGIGLSDVTHVFNAMGSLHHRSPGAVGVALVDDRLTCEVIADGIHLHPAILKLLVKAKGPDKLILITDAIAGTGMPSGKYSLGGEAVIVEKGHATLKDGTIAGSLLTMNKAVRNMCKYAGVTLQQAVGMATINPARVIGVDDRKGTLTRGKDADIVVFDKDINVKMTIVHGAIAYKKGAVPQ
jgi:N-acetylglucosamine-6-phosphate deacetylase